MHKFLVLILLPTLVACSSLQRRNVVNDEAVDQQRKTSEVELELESEETTEEQPLEISETEAETEEEEKTRNYVLVPKEITGKMKKWLHYYTVKDRARIQRFLNRGAKYKEVIEDTLEENGLPPDLYYIGILESGFSLKARSHAGAVGPWQFMRPTGKEYGLRIDGYVDERHDPIRSTESAVKYLKELYRQKRSWYLALAAYNAGPGRVRRAMRRGGTRNYWSLSRKRLLPRDTREYVPQFLALLTIGQNLEKYGFHEKADVDYPDVELVRVPAPVKLSDIARINSIPLKDLKQVNPHLVRGMTPAGRKTYEIWVPQGNAKRVKTSTTQLARLRIKGLKPRAMLASHRSTHKVRRGQNLSTIARRYGMSVAYLKRINNLKSSRIYAGQRLRVRASRYKRSHTYHVVRKGQNLSTIAKRYRMSTTRLKKLNGLRSSKILIGQRLRVKSRQRLQTRTLSPTKYKVRRGDNLTTIARRFKTSVNRIKRLNRLKSSRIYPGRVLIVAQR